MTAVQTFLPFDRCRSADSLSPNFGGITYLMELFGVIWNRNQMAELLRTKLPMLDPTAALSATSG